MVRGIDHITPCITPCLLAAPVVTLSTYQLYPLAVGGTLPICSLLKAANTGDAAAATLLPPG